MPHAPASSAARSSARMCASSDGSGARSSMPIAAMRSAPWPTSGATLFAGRASSSRIEKRVERRPAQSRSGADAAPELAQLLGARGIGRKRRGRKTAQSDDLGGDALADRVGRGRERGQREVGVRVEVDEARRQREPSDVDRTIAAQRWHPCQARRCAHRQVPRRQVLLARPSRRTRSRRERLRPSAT